MPRPYRDPFRRWIRAVGVRAVSRDLNVAVQAVDRWRSGGGVHPARHDAVKRAALRDGYLVTTDDLLPRGR